MTQALAEARDDLEQAAKTADDELRDDIRETADAYRDYVIGDHDPDRTILDAHLNTLRQVRQRADGNTEAKVASALQATENVRNELEQT